jgi:SAM-dependent methyltransferase
MSLRVSQYLERLRMNAIRWYVSGDILDIGCGYGSVVRTFSPARENYVGIEHNPTVVQWLKKQFSDDSLLTFDTDTDPIPVTRDVDAILMIAVLEHLAHLERLTAVLLELLKPAGKVVLTTPTPVGGRVHTLGGGLGVFSREAKDDHKGFYGLDSLTLLFQSSGLKLVDHRHFMAGMNQLAIFQRV